MILAVDPADADKTVKALQEAGEQAYIVGDVVTGNKEVIL